ncbi:YMGG-like glycine zipper-containing protein [Lamprobacter modestohalophilus]|nr:YMGG-like glycine zipper-containing protein [Lamprobacter modestohalophilus]MCF7993648.1 glycine zipper 2TM domain-containing protein [Chromatiaceae bacterium]
MHKLLVLTITALITISLSGCLATTGGTNEQTGTAVGTAGGALLGGIIANNTGNNTLMGALIGGAVGGLIGNRIGAALDERERKELALMTERAARAKANRPITTEIPPKPQKVAKTSSSKSSSSSGSSSKSKAATTAKPTKLTVTPGEIYTKSDGQQCRNISQVAVKDGKTYKDSATMCKSGSDWTAAAV